MMPMRVRPYGSAGWLAGVIGLAVVVALWLVWRLGGAVSVPPERQVGAPSMSFRSMSNPQSTPTWPSSS